MGEGLSPPSTLGDRTMKTTLIRIGYMQLFEGEAPVGEAA